MRLSKIAWNAGATTLALSVPTRPWTPAVQGVGAGVEESASGVPSAWITRRERSLQVPLRFTEAEWPSVRAWLENAQGGATFDFYPDASAATAHTCYLVAPRIEETVRPTRGEHFGTLELTVEIRRTDGAAIEPEYFDG